MLIMDESPDLDTAFYTTLEIVVTNKQKEKKQMTDRQIEERMTEKEIRKSVDRAFKQLDKERQQREQARKSNADNARARMIRRMTTDKPNSKPSTGWSKPPLWSN